MKTQTTAEQFQDQTAFEFHSNAPYIKEFFGKADELLAVPAELTFLMKLKSVA